MTHIEKPSSSASSKVILLADPTLIPSRESRKLAAEVHAEDKCLCVQLRAEGLQAKAAALRGDKA